MRIGLFGGTFNPVHFGHLEPVDEVRRAFSLDRVVLIPAAVPPHKPRRDVAEARDRLAMVRLAAADRPGLTVSDVEIRRQGVSYSIDTVNHFHRTEALETTLFFIVGVDAFLELDTWKAHDELLERLSFIVMTRPGGAAGGSRDEQRAAMTDFLRDRLSDQYRYDPGRCAFVHARKQSLHLCPVTPVDISSTRIRESLRCGRSVADLVPPPVYDYLCKRGLYR